MGKEARCTARLGRERSEGKAHLETDSLRFTGDFRINVPFAQMHSVLAKDGTLRFEAPVGSVQLDLGNAAPKWADAILHPKTRLEKLGVKPAHKVCVLAVGDTVFATELNAVLDKPAATAIFGTYDLIFRGLETKRDLASIGKLRSHLVPDGALWLVYRKGKGAPLPENVVREAFLATGLVDVKIAAFSATHTSVKLVIPKGER
ncbi:MAG: hypothetical protein GIW95_10125 [Candidatus Eremiobacteraeota bacterium]|nr:hypothetical protein [Candidatus Eremiobacteraeota bacterium]